MIELSGPDDVAFTVDVHLYSDNTPFIKIEDFECWHDLVDTITIKANSLMTLVAGLFLVDSFNRYGDLKTLVLPYVPGARQDRINPGGDVLFTAESVAEMINQRCFEEVRILDPHSPVITNKLYNVTVFDTDFVLANHWKGYNAIIAPDQGGVFRAEMAASVLGKEVIYGSKHRNVADGKLSGFSIDVTPGAHYLVVDDICDGGGTFIGLGEKIREQGAYADLYVTHGIFSKGTRELFGIYKNIYTTDSLTRNENDGVMTIPVVERMKNA